MFINLSIENAVDVLERYFEDIQERKYYINDVTINLSFYFYNIPTFYKECIQKYISCVELIFANMEDDKYKILNEWKIVLVHDGIFFSDIFTIKDVIFIKKSKIYEFITMNNLNENFIKDMTRARLNVIFYNNFSLWKKYIEEQNICKIINISKYKLKHKYKLYKNIEYSFMEKNIIIYSNHYTYTEKITDSTVLFSPYYETVINKINIENNSMYLDKQDIMDDLYINPFDKMKIEFIKKYF